MPTLYTFHSLRLWFYRELVNVGYDYELVMSAVRSRGKTRNVEGLADRSCGNTD